MSAPRPILYPPVLVLPDIQGDILISFEADGSYRVRPGLSLEQAMAQAAAVLAMVCQPGYERDSPGVG